MIEHLHFSNSGNNIFVSISESQSQSIAVIIRVVTSENLYTKPNESSWHSNLDSSKISFNIISLICDNILTSDFQTKSFVNTFNMSE